MAVTVQKTASPLSRNTAELLLDLVEIKLGCMEVWDREDARELKALERARAELSLALGRGMPARLVQMTVRGRRPMAVAAPH